MSGTASLLTGLSRQQTAGASQNRRSRHSCVMDDADAFAILYRREGESVLIFLTRRTWDGETALELTAETFALALRSWRRLSTLAPEQQRAWLFTVARRQLARYVRRARVERRAVRRLGMQLPEVEQDDLLLIERRAGLAELREMLRGELSRLSDGQREALQLRVIEELSYVQMARALGISEQTARARVSRGLRALAEALEPYRAAEGQLLDRSGAPEGTS
jgi:RNA polymerase sigma factor (sigma-70 family)